MLVRGRALYNKRFSMQIKKPHLVPATGIFNKHAVVHCVIVFSRAVTPVRRREKKYLLYSTHAVRYNKALQQVKTVSLLLRTLCNWRFHGKHALRYSVCVTACVFRNVSREEGDKNMATFLRGVYVEELVILFINVACLLKRVCKVGNLHQFRILRYGIRASTKLIRPVHDAE